jgi:hypothetical protein
MVAFGRQAYGFGILVGLLGFVVLHSLIAHSANDFGGYSPALEIMKAIEQEKRQMGGAPDRVGKGPAEGGRKG